MRGRLIKSSYPMPTQARPASAKQFFSRGGTLSQWHPNYEHRPGQVEMAESVESALADKRHLIVEAGTGTGKTLAYLVPALLSGKRIIVSTGTKNRRPNRKSGTGSGKCLPGSYSSRFSAAPKGV